MQRAEVYEKLLANDTRFRRSVHMMQIAPPSRDSIKEYQETSDTLDAICGRVMGRFADPDWSTRSPMSSAPMVSPAWPDCTASPASS
ncbi:MAG: hypothetical protein MO852_05740 [Candidatus Devosia euplotis]|nr:hypothetical protein [Candidatus Devosia euplotis]